MHPETNIIKVMKKLLFLILFGGMTQCVCAQRIAMDLAGQWTFSTSATGESSEVVMLPGTTDTNGKGERNSRTDETTRLSRRYIFSGKAYYSRDIMIPASWKGKTVTLFLERTKPATVYVDGKECGHCDDISVPHVYDLTAMLKPGSHRLTIMVDNSGSVPEQVLRSSHACTEDTQTNWNGIIGRICLEAGSAAIAIESIKTAPDAEGNSVAVELLLRGKPGKRFKVGLSVEDRDGKAESVLLTPENRRFGKDSLMTVRYTYHFRQEAKRWSEFTPDNIYTLRVTAECAGEKDVRETTFGVRDFKVNDHHFAVNGRPTFLRGKHDACVFPLTGHVVMDYEGWHKYLATCREYGINHIRFHSWCPPEACFKAADDLGIYLQPELPVWGGFDENDQWLTTFLRDEGRKIIATYGNHPSFVMMGLGNELWGSTELMADYVSDFKRGDDVGQGARRLYTYGSNMFLGFKGAIEGMDYFTTARVGGEKWGEYDTHVRGSFAFCDAWDGGIINHQYPNTMTNFERAVAKSDIPVISHETGQFQTYPDYSEIDKYTGVLQPLNLMTFKSRLEEAGMATQAADFHYASGRWAVELYKADMEMDLRTGNMAGFQLLDIQDYPGQGSAFVGILDAFMETKGIVSPERWRQWCSDIVPMAELPRFTFTEGDTIRWNAVIANYSQADSILEGRELRWMITTTDGTVIGNGSERLKDVKAGVNSIAENAVKAKLPKPGTATKARLTMEIGGTTAGNAYDLWIYPGIAGSERMTGKNVMVADTLDDAVMACLDKGGSVLLMPRREMYAKQTVGGLVQTDYWNYRMFRTISENNKKPVSPGTLGILVNDTAHHIFRSFPTERHSNWQWAPIVHESRPLIMDCMAEGFRPLVQVIDNVERNHRLALIFEAAIGNGKVLVCMSDLRLTAQYPESRQLMQSILEYVGSDAFSPASRISPADFRKLFTEDGQDRNIGDLKNISYE